MQTCCKTVGFGTPNTTWPWEDESLANLWSQWGRPPRSGVNISCTSMIEVLAPKYGVTLQPNQILSVTLTCKAGANRQRWTLLNPPIQYQPLLNHSLHIHFWKSEVYCHVPLTCFNAHVASAMTTKTSSSVTTIYSLILYSNKCTVKNCSLYNWLDVWSMMQRILRGMRNLSDACSFQNMLLQDCIRLSWNIVFNQI